MKNETKKRGCLALCFLAIFLGWTVAVRFVDVQTIGPNDSAVGFATVNGYFHNLTGVNFTLYTITDWLGLVPVFIGFGFGLLGLVQWIKRKRLSKVDYTILVLGGFYLAVMGAYLFFEECVINYRPVLINGYLEASYPSSTTLLVLCVMPTALLQLNSRIQNVVTRRCVATAILLFTAFMVIGRLVSGVHWLTDIVGGTWLSAGLVQFYRAVCCLKTT